MAGQMVHLEIPAGDTGKAREFWGGLFGWEFQAYEGSPSEYHDGAFLGEPGRRDHGGRRELRKALASTSTSTTSTPARPA